jgi:tripartite-type tricarboxylate transporter receptor subunit TctC
MTTKFRTLITTVISGLALGLSLSAAKAQDAYPTKPIRVVVPFAPGGNTDVVARIIAGKMSTDLGQPVVIDNRPGAGGNLGSDLVAKAPADGYTLLVGTLSTHALNVALYSSLPFDPVRDFAPVALTNHVPLVLVAHPSVKSKDLSSFIGYAKDKAGALNYGSAGSGTSSHLAAVLFNEKAGIKAEHISYKGSAPAINDLLAGQVHYMFDAPSILSQHIGAGKLTALAVAMPKRSALLPNVPTMAEAGLPGYEAYSWNAWFAPKGTPALIVERLNKSVADALQDAEIKSKLVALGLEASERMDAPTVTRFVKTEYDKWVPIVKATGAKAD